MTLAIILLFTLNLFLRVQHDQKFVHAKAQRRDRVRRS